MYRILHCADFHLDASFAAQKLTAELGNRRRGQLCSALGRVLTLAREHEVEAVTIAGDLYEEAYALPDTADFLADQFARLSPIQVYIAPGACDPYSSDSLYASMTGLPNVCIFDSARPNRREPSPGINLWGVAHPISGEDVLRDLTRTKGLNLLLMNRPDGTDPSGWAMQAIDLALLGGRHLGCDLDVGSTRCVWPGSPEPLSPAELGGRHDVVLVQIESNCFTLERIPVGRWQYRSIEIDCTGCQSAEDLAARISAALGKGKRKDEQAIQCDVRLTGETRVPISLAEVEASVGSKMLLRLVARDTRPDDLDGIRVEPTVRGELVRRCEEKIRMSPNEADRIDLANALHAALRALEGRAVRSDEIR